MISRGGVRFVCTSGLPHSRMLDRISPWALKAD